MDPHNWQESQDLIDDAFRYLNGEFENDLEARRLIDGLLDICAECAQGFEYPSYMEDEDW